MKERLKMKHFWTIFILTFTSFSSAATDHSVARRWNELLLESIRNDFARPTVHARNLFHLSVAMYDAWATYDTEAKPYFLGNTLGGYHCWFSGIGRIKTLDESREEAISYAAYRLLVHRFQNSPAAEEMLAKYDQLMDELGYDTSFTSTDYEVGQEPAALGNYIASELIVFGMTDGSNEAEGYANRFYKPVNPNLLPQFSGIEELEDPNAWQPLEFVTFIDQSGNEIPGGIPPFLGAEWGQVVPFSLSEEDLSVYHKNGNEYWVYHDPGMPALINVEDPTDESSLFYKWNFDLVVRWSSHLDPADEVYINISPAVQGNVQMEDFPVTPEEYRNFYQADGTTPEVGYELNPITNEPYKPQIVKRSDYARVLAEFWADGPDSETPPGHWFTILNYVSDHPLLEKKLFGEGPVLSDLEWDIKSYFILGGTMHDAAVTAWGIKGYYNYIRPISAIRYMAGKGQCTDTSLPNYHPEGIPLSLGNVEVIDENDPLSGINDEHVGKIKVRAWKGHSIIEDPETEHAGVEWIRAENWVPYQRQTFVTPPFAGYVSGHSTFSRAAAEVLSKLTGSEYFPGGVGEFAAPKDKFLVFENGPSEDIVLQWAKYSDASDQCSLSRIWGGIHPPVDDIAGRRIGYELGNNAFHHAVSYFQGKVLGTSVDLTQIKVYPNPVQDFLTVNLGNTNVKIESVHLMDLTGRKCYTYASYNEKNQLRINLKDLQSGVYLLDLPSLSNTIKIVKK